MIPSTSIGLSLPAETSSTPDPLRVIISDTTDTYKPGYGFRGYQYATAKVCFKMQGTAHELCLDSGCIMSLIDREFLYTEYPDAAQETKKMPTPMTVRGIGKRKHDANEYVRITLFFPTPFGIGSITRELHIVDNLTAKVLIGIDILSPEHAVLDFDRSILRLGCCKDLEVPIEVKNKENRTNQIIVVSKQFVTIPPRSQQAVAIGAVKRRPLQLAEDRDFIFEARTLDSLSIYAHIVDANTENVLVRNDTDRSVNLAQNTNLGQILEYNAAGCFSIHAKEACLAAKSPKRSPNWVRQSIKGALTAAAAFTAAFSPTAKEIVHPSGVTIYGAPAAPQILALSQVIENHPKVWQDTGNVTNIPEDWHMEIPLVEKWREIYKPGQAKVYPVGPKDRAIIDPDFDKLHAQGRMEWTTTSTPFAFPCFVIWKMAEQGPKGRTVVDIRALNQITMPDAYPIPLQSEILGLLRDATYISTIDLASFFYQC